MKQAIIGDQHLFVAYGEVDRKADHEQAIRGTLEVLDGEKPDLIVLTGDLSHDWNPRSDVAIGIIDYLRLMCSRAFTIWTPGNHEVTETNDEGIVSLIIRESRLSGDMLIVADRPMVLSPRAGGQNLGRLACFPYVPRWKRKQEDLDAVVAEIRKGVSGIYGHMTSLDGAVIGKADSYERGHHSTARQMAYPEALKDLPITIYNGHWHSRQTVSFGKATVEIPGSTMRMSFAEKDDTKGILIAQL